MDTDGTVLQLETKPPVWNEFVVIPSTTDSPGISTTFFPHCKSKTFLSGVQ